MKYFVWFFRKLMHNNLPIFLSFVTSYVNRAHSRIGVYGSALQADLQQASVILVASCLPSRLLRVRMIWWCSTRLLAWSYTQRSDANEDTLVNVLLSRYPEMRSYEEDLRSGIVHRLDRDTSGLLIVARNLRNLAALIELMKQHEVEKRYLALVEGVVELDRGSIDAPIGCDPRDRQKMTITSIDSRDAVTHFKVLERYSQHTLLLLQRETGRTHQIRVHLKAIKHPIVALSLTLFLI